MVKADGSVSVHSDGRAYKPLNWMTQPCDLRVEPGRWVVTNTRGESLTIVIDEIHLDVTRDLGADPGLQKDGVEAHLQELLAANPGFLLDGLRLVRREYPTDIGPVDLLCRDADGRAVAVEIKRRGEIDGVEQLARYIERLDLDGGCARFAASWPPSRSSRRLRWSPRPEASSASRSTTTTCGPRGPTRLTLF